MNFRFISIALFSPSSSIYSCYNFHLEFEKNSYSLTLPNSKIYRLKTLNPFLFYFLNCLMPFQNLYFKINFVLFLYSHFIRLNVLFFGPFIFYPNIILSSSIYFIEIVQYLYISISTILRMNFRFFSITLFSPSSSSIYSCYKI